jgi:hypothetical protein
MALLSALLAKTCVDHADQLIKRGANGEHPIVSRPASYTLLGGL